MSNKAINKVDIINGLTSIENKYLTFYVMNEEYGIEIQYIKEVVKICAIRKIPHTPSTIKGVINLRGEIIPVVDIREIFSMKTKDYDSKTCIIIIEYNKDIVGLIVDEVNEVLDIHSKNLSKPPNASFKYNNEYIKYVTINTEKSKLMLDAEKLLFEIK